MSDITKAEADLVEVVQADRDAAAAWWRYRNEHELAAFALAGGHDSRRNSLVQAFAKHRSQARMEEREAIVAKIREVAAQHYADEGDAGRRVALMLRADAIEAGDHLPTLVLDSGKAG